MPTRQEKIEKRVLKAGVRAAKKIHHVPNEEELRKLKIQVVPGAFRLIVLVAGIAMIFCALLGWPVDVDSQQALIGIGGGVLVIFAIVGVRRTVGNVLDAMSSEGASALLEVIFTLIGDALGSLGD